MSLAGLHDYVVAATVAPHAQEHAAVFDTPTQLHGFIGAAHALAVDFQDDIARAQTCCGRGRSQVHVHDQRAAHMVGNVELATGSGVEGFDDDAIPRVGAGVASVSSMPGDFGHTFR